MTDTADVLAVLNDHAIALAGRELGKAATRQDVDAFWRLARGVYYAAEPTTQAHMRRLRSEALARVAEFQPGEESR